MGPTGGVGQGANTPVAMGTTGLAPSQAHELVNGKKSIIYPNFCHQGAHAVVTICVLSFPYFVRSEENSLHSRNCWRDKFSKCCGRSGQVGALKQFFLEIFPLKVYPASRGFFLAWLLGLLNSFASLVSRVVGLFYISPRVFGV